MSGYFGLLPPELMQDIFDRLHFKELAPLMRCSKALYAYVEPEIFRRDLAREVVMDWAISHGQMKVVRNLVERYNASPSFYGGMAIITASDGTTRLWKHPQLTILAVLKRAPDIEEALATFVRLGTSLFPDLSSQATMDQVGRMMNVQYFLSILYKQMRSLLRRIVSMPTKTEKQRRDKMALVRFFYDQGYRAKPDIFEAPCNIAHTLPRLIHRDEDLPIIKYILEQEMKIEEEEKQARAKQNGGSEPGDEPAKIPLVDRPERCGPHGAPISPLSAAVLTNSVRVFEYLLQLGADINGPALDFQKYGPTAYALHIPIFAAAYLLARRKTNDSGENWMQICMDNKANINEMALCRLSGTHKPYRSVVKSLSYYSQGLRYPPKHYFWATPLDVFIDCLPRHYLTKKRGDDRESLDDDNDDDIVLSAQRNIAVFQQYGAYANLGSRREPPRARRPVSVEDSSIYVGPPTDASLDKWRNLTRVVSPLTLEILLDRISVSGLAFPVACSYAEFVATLLPNGMSQAARLMSKYDGPAPETQFPTWPSGRESTGRRTLALILLCDDFTADQDAELQRYIVYVQRRADLLFMGNVLNNLEQVFSGPRSMVNVSRPYVPNPVVDDIEVRQLALEGATSGDISKITESPGTKKKLPHWTALHELCWIWNNELWNRDQNIAEGDEDVTEPRFAWQPATTTTLLNALISYGFSVTLDAGDGTTPIDVLTNDHDGTLRPQSKEFLGKLANFMSAASAVVNL
ncbi:hypothetical protein SEUCBS139899_003344 [Sporothrix eucalyptigena]